MVQIALIGLGAGAASALLFASIASGSILSVALFYLAPLPILIAAIGWSHWAALVATVASTTSLAVVFGLKFCLAFFFSVAGPAWWLGYLSLLARPGMVPGGLEWYPAGHLVMWTALLGAFAIAAAIPYIGLDEETFNATLRSGFERVLKSRNAGPANPGRVLDFLVAIVPPAAAALGAVVQMLNLWLAGRIVKLSGRLRRPWPDIPSMRLPRIAAALTIVAIAGSFVPDIPGLIAGVFGSALLIAYAALGLAVVHALTRSLRSRGVVLGAVYTVLLIFGWPILLISLLGLADSAFDIRAFVAARRGPPPVPRS